MSSVTLVFPAATRQQRLRAWRGRLFGVRGAVSLACALGPGVVLLVLGANPPFPAGALAIGFVLFLFGWLVSVLAGLVEKASDRVLELGLGGVRDTRAGLTVERPWQWVRRVEETAETLTLYVPEEELRSFRIGIPSASVLVIDKRGLDPESLVKLQRLLTAVRR